MARMKYISGCEISEPSRYVLDFANAKDKTIQSAKDDCDINVIMRRFAVAGKAPPLPSMAPFYGDFSEVEDFQSACNRVVQARETFQALPAKVRNRFDNDPAKLFMFLDDDRNLEEARALGLANPAVAAPEPQLVRVVADPPADPPK